MNWHFFRNKRQAERLKAVDLAKSRRTKSTTLTLSKLSVNHYPYLRNAEYNALVVYAENPGSLYPGIKELIEIKASSWHELLDKVAEHFEETA